MCPTISWSSTSRTRPLWTLPCLGKEFKDERAEDGDPSRDLVVNAPLEFGSKFIDHSEFGFKVIAHSPDCKQYCRIQFLNALKNVLPALDIKIGRTSIIKFRNRIKGNYVFFLNFVFFNKHVWSHRKISIVTYVLFQKFLCFCT